MRCDEWFDSIDADRNGELSYHELRACSYFRDLLSSLAQSLYRRRALEQ